MLNSIPAAEVCDATVDDSSTTAGLTIKLPIYPRPTLRTIQALCGTTATFYTYDIHGNVNQLLQDYRGVTNLPSADRLKTIYYRYDLISGKVNRVVYQPGHPDQFTHVYGYDAENRLTNVKTSHDGRVREEER